MTRRAARAEIARKATELSGIRRDHDRAGRGRRGHVRAERIPLLPNQGRHGPGPRCWPPLPRCGPRRSTACDQWIDLLYPHVLPRVGGPAASRELRARAIASAALAWQSTPGRSPRGRRGWMSCSTRPSRPCRASSGGCGIRRCAPRRAPAHRGAGARRPVPPRRLHAEQPRQRARARPGRPRRLSRTGPVPRARASAARHRANATTHGRPRASPSATSAAAYPPNRRRPQQQATSTSAALGTRQFVICGSYSSAPCHELLCG